MREYEVAVIGGGPAGIMAAGIASQAGHKTVLLEKMEKPLRKLRITGKGRCNLTNMRPADEILEKVKTNAAWFSYALSTFDNRTTYDFFERNGLEMTIERGSRVFPSSGKAWDVADTLMDFARKSGVEIICNSRVDKIERNASLGFKITVQEKNETWTYYANKIIVTTGGMAYPATGSTGDGYRLAHDLGHNIEPIRPSLVPIVLDSPYLKQLSGLALKNVNLDLMINSEPVDERFGELEFTPFGITGPIVLQLSRQIVDALIEEYDVTLSLDLKPNLSKQILTERITRELSEITHGGMAKVLLQKLLPREMIDPIARLAGIDLRLFADKITPQQISKLIDTIKDFRLTVVDYRPFEEAIVTAGGVDVEQIDPRTMQSKVIPGLYFAGELLDLDADTGGYNLQIAFSTGYLAGCLND